MHGQSVTQYCTNLHVITDINIFHLTEYKESFLMSTTQPLMILIAGPYRSGTGDDPELMARNLRALESVALPLYRAGHIPLIGEWIALPLLREAGSKQPGDAIYEEILYPVANRLLKRCDAVLRIPGASKGADEDVRLAKAQGLPVFASLAEVPGYEAGTKLVGS
jgi:hypothetical protein